MVTNKARILVVEDEPAIREGLTDVLVFHGFDVDAAATGDEGLTKALAGSHDLILLDVMLPGVDGFSICEAVRAKSRAQPIILLTARSSDEDVIHGLKLGADDYVAKPFSVQQLVLRIEAVLRRTLPTVDEIRTLEIGPTVIDLKNLTGRGDAGEIQFTKREASMLGFLAKHTDRPVERSELLEKVWGYGGALHLETRTVDIHVAKLRRKIEPDSANPRYLVTVRGVGYRLQLEDGPGDPGT